MRKIREKVMTTVMIVMACVALMSVKVQAAGVSDSDTLTYNTETNTFYYNGVATVRKPLDDLRRIYSQDVFEDQYLLGTESELFAIIHARTNATVSVAVDPIDPAARGREEQKKKEELENEKYHLMLKAGYPDGYTALTIDGKPYFVYSDGEAVHYTQSGNEVAQVPLPIEEGDSFELNDNRYGYLKYDAMKFFQKRNTDTKAKLQVTGKEFVDAQTQDVTIVIVDVVTGKEWANGYIDSKVAVNLSQASPVSITLKTDAVVLTYDYQGKIGELQAIQDIRLAVNYTSKKASDEGGFIAKIERDDVIISKGEVLEIVEKGVGYYVIRYKNEYYEISIKQLEQYTQNINSSQAMLKQGNAEPQNISSLLQN